MENTFENNSTPKDFNIDSLSPEEKERVVTLRNGHKVILTYGENPTKAFDTESGEIIDVSPDDIDEMRA